MYFLFGLLLWSVEKYRMLIVGFLNLEIELLLCERFRVVEFIFWYVECEVCGLVLIFGVWM